MLDVSVIKEDSVNNSFKKWFPKYIMSRWHQFIKDNAGKGLTFADLSKQYRAQYPDAARSRSRAPSECVGKSKSLCQPPDCKYVSGPKRQYCRTTKSVTAPGSRISKARSVPRAVGATATHYSTYCKPLSRAECKQTPVCNWRERSQKCVRGYGTKAVGTMHTAQRAAQQWKKSLKTVNQLGGEETVQLVQQTLDRLESSWFLGDDYAYKLDIHEDYRWSDEEMAAPLFVGNGIVTIVLDSIHTKPPKEVDDMEDDMGDDMEYDVEINIPVDGQLTVSDFINAINPHIHIDRAEDKFDTLRKVGEHKYRILIDDWLLNL